MYGFVYCLDNFLAMPGLYKVGHTMKSPHQRAHDLSTTGVPHPFSVVGYIEIENPQAWETRFHRFLDEYRSNGRREFFRAPMTVLAPLFLRNEWATSHVDIDFSPALYIDTRDTDGGPKSVEELPNPYHEHPWLNAEP